MRPQPPPEVTDVIAAVTEGPKFAPAPELWEWATATFIAADGALANPDHSHLIAARIGMLWTNATNSRHGMAVLGQCEYQPPGGSMGKWARARAQAQLRSWFGGALDFLLTFYAPFATFAPDPAFCALVEHELYHCGQAKDEFGQPKFIKDTGIPVFTMRGHDIEEFAGIVRRYGPVTPEIAAMLDAGAEIPNADLDLIRGACGSCHA
jgi:hypothetical protein